MKTVFKDNQEVCHVWASQSQDVGRAGNVSFDGNTIYSYSTAMGKIIGNAVLLNRRNYSVTTSAHQSLIAQAVSHLKRFHVDSVKPDHDVNIAAYVEQIKFSFGSYFRARSRKAFIFDENHNTHQQLIDYANHFKINYPASIGQWVLASTDEVALAQKESYIKKQKQERLAAKKAIEKAEFRWMKNRSNQTFVVVNGKTFNFSKVLLRVNQFDKEVETSMRARVPLKAARILYKLIKAGKPVHGHTIGHYTVLSCNGELKIGCHSIDRAEVDRIAKAMNW